MSRVIPFLFLFACGRTEPVRYSGDPSEEDFAARLPDGGVACVDGDLALLPTRPVVMLVVDRSSSMNQSFAGSSTGKWSALRSALHQALPPWDARLELGALFFPSTTSNACTVNAAVDLEPALNNVNAVLSRLDATSPSGSTPTAVAIERAGATLASRRAASSARGLILATDGAPDCNSALNPSTCTCVGGGGGRCTAVRCLDDTRSIERLSTLAASNIPTWIVGLRGNSDAAFVDVLNRMAIAGGKPQAGAQRFYSASSQAELESAMNTIGEQVGRCHYLTPSVPDLGGSIELRIEGDFVPYDVTQTNGWSWVDADNGELELHGDTCTRAERLPVEALSVIVHCAP